MAGRARVHGEGGLSALYEQMHEQIDAWGSWARARDVASMSRKSFLH
jgi:hypothetical protein